MTDDVATIMAFVAWATAAVCAVWLYARRAHPRRKVRAADGHTVRFREGVRPAGRQPFTSPPDLLGVSVDPLARLEAEWLADPRPAWETVAEFERQVGYWLGEPDAAELDRAPRKKRERPEALTGYRRGTVALPAVGSDAEWAAWMAREIEGT